MEAVWTSDTSFPSQLAAADRVWGLQKPPSLKFSCQIFLFMLQQNDTAPYAHESDPVQTLQILLLEELS